MKLGIAGTGKIVQTVLETYDILEIEETWLLSTPRSVERAQQLCEKYGLAGYICEYDKLLASDIDTVYIALPNHLHYEYAKKALQNGKHVIIEKPIAVNECELLELITLAKEQDKRLLEAMNIHHLPAYQKLKNYIDKLGRVKIVSFNYSQYSSRYDAFKRGELAPVFDRSKAGGVLMDLNVYNIHAVLGLFGAPEQVYYQANVEQGIDTSGILVMNYGDFQAVCIGAKDCEAPVMLTIQGDEGAIVMHTPVNQLTLFTYIPNHGQPETIQEQEVHRLSYEFKEFIRIIEEADKDSEQKLLEISLAAVKVMEKARKEAGIVFPNDEIIQQQ